MTVSYLTQPYDKFLAWLVRRSEGSVCAHIGMAELIGPAPYVQQCKDVLKELRLDSFDLYDALVNREPFTICLVPGYEKSAMNRRLFVIGHSYLKWGDEGLRAYLVWQAFRTQANLHRTSVVLDEWYSKGTLNTTVIDQTVRWLTDHHQPEILIKYFASFGTKPVHNHESTNECCSWTRISTFL